MIHKRILSFLFALAMFAIPARCQVTYTPGSGNSCTIATCTATFTSTKSGDTIFLGMFIGSPAITVSNVVDSQGNNFQTLGCGNWSTNGQYRECLFYAGPIKGGADTITSTLSAAIYSEMHPYDYSNLGPLDINGPATGKTTASSANGSSASITTHNANDFLVSFFHSDGGAINVAGTGWTGRYQVGQSSSNAYPQMEDKAVTAVGSYAGTMSANIACNWIGFVAAFTTLSTSPPNPPVSVISATASVPGKMTIAGTSNGTPASVVLDTGPNNPITLSVSPNAHAVNLTWGASTSPGVLTYAVFRSLTSGAYSSTALGNTTVTNYTDGTVVAGQTYYYVIQAVAAPCTSTTPAGTTCGNSQNSNEVKTIVPTP